MLRSCYAAVLLIAASLHAAPANADEVAPSERESSAVLVREGPSTDTTILARLGASIFAISSGPYPYRRVRLPDDEIVTELDARGEVFRTDCDDLFRIGDEERSCEFNPRKVGSDADEAPGGCNSIVIKVAGSGAIAASYSSVAD